MAFPGMFGFEPYRLVGVQAKERELGRGSYAVVLELEYRGLRCAGKKVHRVLYERGVGGIVHRFEDECRLLSQMRHPNIVQFLGVYFERENSRVPVLVMEYLPISIANTLEAGVLPGELIYSVLRDVALGLCYLHNHSPPIIHRDLSANKVLLTSDFSAKISDLGMAKILNLTPQQCMTRAPGTPAYMPPEALVARPHYTTKMDIFSYGILIIHILSGQWPIPLCEAVCSDPNNPNHNIPVSEADRRDEYLAEIGYDHPLMELIRRCIQNCFGQRPKAEDILQQMDQMMISFPPTFVNKLEMLQQIQVDAEEKQRLRDDKQRLVAQVAQIQAETRELRRQNHEDTHRLCLVHSLEVEQLHIRIAELGNQVDALESLLSSKDKEISAKNCEAAMKNDQLASQDIELASKHVLLERKACTIQRLDDQLERARKHLFHKCEPHPFVPNTRVNWEDCTDLPIETSKAQAAVIDGKVYFGGGQTHYSAVHGVILVYTPSQDTWNSLPSCPLNSVGLGQFEGNLVAVGGIDDVSNEIYKFDERFQSWNKSIPPMPTARAVPSVLGYESSLIVAGGSHAYASVDVVEVFRLNTSQWYRTNSLPAPQSGMSSVVIRDTWYLLGGSCEELDEDSNAVMCASVSVLLQHATPLHDKCSTATDCTQCGTAWKALIGTPLYGSAAASLGSSLLAIGGKTSPDAQLPAEVQGTVYIYSPSTESWVKITTFPSPCMFAATAMLSHTEILVIGGMESHWDHISTVHRGYLV